MPKAAKDALIWLPEEKRYTIRRDGKSMQTLLTDNETTWFAWLATVRSFSFQGQQGHANLLKEQRKGSDAGYWYAYQRQGKQVRKRYIGRSAELSFARLEAIVHLLMALGADKEPSVETTTPASPFLGNKPSAAPDAPLQPMTANAQSTAVLLPKLQLPRLHNDLIARPRLLRQLDQALTRRLTVVAAPAGFGKTTVVRQWIGARSAEGEMPAVAWVGLDVEDNDPVRFWRYLIEAYQKIDRHWGEATLAQLATITQLPFAPTPLEAILTTLLNTLSQATQSTLLILDDFHLIRAGPIHTALTFFLEHLPNQMHLLLLTRSTPPLPLARWRVRNELLEIGVADLRFSSGETQTFLQQILTLPQLSATEQEPARQALRRLETSLAGWAAGWRLLALALEKATSVDAVEQLLATFAGSHRSLIDYFVEEVLNTLSPPMQRFLLQISMLGRFTVSLCSAVTTNPESGKFIDHLAQAGLFLESLDGESGWHRLHPLFAEVMQHEARRRLGAQALHAVAAQASHWYADAELPAEAIEAALRVPDFDRAAMLIRQLHRAQPFTGSLQQPGLPNEFHTIQRWLAQFPTVFLHQQPDLSLDYATALLMIHFSERHSDQVLNEFDVALGAADAGFRAVDDRAKLAEVFAFRALLARHQGQITQAATWAAQALVWLPADALAWRSVSLSAMAIGELFSGSLDRAYVQIETALTTIAEVNNPYFLRAIIGQLSAISFERGALHETAGYLRPMLAEARAVGDEDDIGHAQLGLAKIDYAWNKLDDALNAATEACLAIARTDNEALIAEAMLLLAQIAFAQGRPAEAQRQLAALLPQLPRQQSPRHNELYRETLRLQAYFALRTGDLAAGERWWRGRNDDTTVATPLYAEREELLAARWLLAQGQTDASITNLIALLRRAAAAQRTQNVLEIQLVLACAHVARQEMAQASVCLQEVVAITAVQGHLRLFLDEGPVLLPLLRSLFTTLTNPTERSHVRQIVQAFADADPTAAVAMPLDLVEPLSPQEVRVLHLLATGSTNAEIAQTLIVSVNTIRSQLQSIYRKLDVSNRVAAVETARRHGLLGE